MINSLHSVTRQSCDRPCVNNNNNNNKKKKNFFFFKETMFPLAYESVVER